MAKPELSDPRDMRIRLREVSRRGDRIDGDRGYGDRGSPYTIISGHASMLVRHVMIAAEMQGLSGEDLMTVLAYNALLQYEKLMDKMLDDAMRNPVPPFIIGTEAKP